MRQHARRHASRKGLGPLAATLIVATSLSSPSLLALDPNKAISQYLHRSWHTADGLPIESIRSIVQTRDGYLWLGTEEGLGRFDGVRFVTFDLRSPPELKVHNIEKLYEGRDGSLWLGTFGGGAVRLKDGVFTAVTTKDGLQSDYANIVGGDRSGNVWIRTRGAGGCLNRFRDGKVTPFTRKDGLSSDVVNVVYEDRAGVLWIGTREGLNRLRDGKVDVFTTKDGLSSDRILSLLEDREGALWIGTNGGGLNRLKDGTFTSFKAKDGLAGDVVRAIVEDRDGHLWIGTTSGLSRFSNGRFASFTTRDGLSGDDVTALLEDREGSLWIGSDGLDRLHDGKFTSLTAGEGLAVLVRQLLADRRGSIWMAGEGGVCRERDGVVSCLTTKEGLSSDSVQWVLEDRAGDVWVSTANGLNRLRGGRMESVEAVDGLPAEGFGPLLEGRDGSLWLGTLEGLYRLRNGRLTVYGTKDGLSSDKVRPLLEDGEGSLWIATPKGLDRLWEGRVTSFALQGSASDWDLRRRASLLDRAGTLWVGTNDGGLCRLRGDERTALTTKEGLPSDEVWQLLEGRDGTLWIGTIPGLSRFNDGKLTPFRFEDGPFDEPVFGLLEDEQGHLWTQSNKGVDRIDRKSLEEFADGRVARPAWTHYDTNDGLPSDEGVGAAGLLTRDGRLWFATSKGVAVVDPARIPTNRVPPPVVLEEVLLDGEVVGRPSTGPPLLVPPGKEKLEIRYTGNSFVVPKRVKFRYRLEGYDSGWVDAGTERVAHYMNLPPRDYTFRVVACNDDGLWNETGASVAITILPFLWQTRWFLALEVLATLGVLAGALLLQRGRLDRRKARELVEELRSADHARKTEELEEARRVQLALLPTEPLTVGPFTVAGRMQTATEVGGDYYGYLEAGGRLCVVIGDATGHGMASGLVAGMLKSALAALSRTEVSGHAPTRWLADLNDALRASISKRGLGVCAGIALGDVESGAVELGMAGIPNPFLVSASGTVERLVLSGTPLGYLKRVLTASTTRTLAPGDLLVLLTDGLVEQTNAAGEEWGYAGVEAALAALASPGAPATTPEGVAEGLLAACERHGSGQPRTDDRTVVVLVRTVASGRSPS